MTERPKRLSEQMVLRLLKRRGRPSLSPSIKTETAIEKMLLWAAIFQEKHLEIPQKRTNFAPQSPRGAL
ncbi:hypothetical protein HMPREF9999_00277 [Alloprevotella sp. oral taxon 473 str. F0040]|nr:hypothetical protein HMPREF9999_00277 [Alloprevotella sp. oral taxon 473 str. F0040]